MTRKCNALHGRSASGAASATGQGASVWRRLLLMALSTTTVSSCIRIPTSLTYRRTQFEAPAQRPGQMNWTETQGLCRVVAALDVTPRVLYIRRNEQVDIWEHLRVMALDSAGQVLGEPRLFDWSFTGRQLQILSDGDVLGRRVGETTLVVRLPAKACDKSSPAQRVSANVTVVVGDTGVTSPKR